MTRRRPWPGTRGDSGRLVGRRVVGSLVGSLVSVTLLAGPLAACGVLPELPEPVPDSVVPSLVAPDDPAGSENLSPDGFNGGVQAGYNWQAGNTVFGIETDIQGASSEDNKTCFDCGPGLTVNSKLPWFGTVRGRLGYAVGPSLFYATGGFAYGGVKTAFNGASFSISPRPSCTSDASRMMSGFEVTSFSTEYVG